MSALVTLRDLCIRAPERALVDGVGVELRAGRVTAVVGASGSGKSLTARALLGVIDVAPGLVRGELRYPELGGDDLYEGVRGAGPRAQRRLARRMAAWRGGYVTYAPQSAASALNPGRTLGLQLALAVRRRREAPASEAAAIREVLDEVGLPHHAASALPHELSGGMAQRAALAIAIAPHPRVLVADEPETGLDPVLRRVITELLLQVASDHGVALMLISHHRETVRRIADEVVVVGADAGAGEGSRA